VSSSPTMEDQEEEKVCRYCFEGESDGELISPCSCSGGQKWVHLTCLRRWQRMVYVSQPTHPDFYGDDDRQKICNVCKSEFTCAPPTRTELMATFTGAEIAALITEHCLIAPTADFSNLCTRLSSSGGPDRQASHWAKSAYLITHVMLDRPRTVRVKFTVQESLENVIKPAGKFFLVLRGKTLDLVFDGSLEAVAEGTPAEKAAAIRGLEVPTTLKFHSGLEGDCGEDGIFAVNLTRKIARLDPRQVNHLLDISPEFGFLADADLLVEPVHFAGGPCEEHKICWAILPGDGHVAVHANPSEAIYVAHHRALSEHRRRQDEESAKPAAGDAAASSESPAQPAKESSEEQGAPRKKRKIQSDSEPSTAARPEGQQSQDGKESESDGSDGSEQHEELEVFFEQIRQLAHDTDDSSEDEDDDDDDDDGDEDDDDDDHEQEQAGGVDSASPAEPAAAGDAGPAAAAEDTRKIEARLSGGSQDSSSGEESPGAKGPCKVMQLIACLTGIPLEPDGTVSASAGEMVRGTPVKQPVWFFWGDARWSRVQLMGEIARGSWGLCRGDMQQTWELPREQLYDKIFPDLVFAPKSEMTEDYAAELEALQRHRRMARHAMEEFLSSSGWLGQD